MQKSGIEEVYVANATDRNLTAIAIIDPDKELLTGEAIPILNGDALSQCVEESVTPCFSERHSSERFLYANINNLEAGANYEIAWANTAASKLLRTGLVTADGSTTTITEELPQLDRLYGRVVNRDELGVESALVVVDEMETVNLGRLAAITNGDGAYSISYDENRAGKNYLQNIKVISSDGEETEYMTASFWNKPVADLVVGEESGDILAYGASTVNESLVGKVNAANSCVTGTQYAGIRIQCNDKIHWTEELDTTVCPSNEKRFKVGLVKHTTSTQYHKPESVTLKLQDSQTGEFLKDPATGTDLVIKNGGYIYYEQLGISYGKKYTVHAYDGTVECTNRESLKPSVTINKPNGTPASSSGSGNSGSGNTGNYANNPVRPDSAGVIPASSTSANMCKKIGENFAVPYEVNGDVLGKASSLGMRWGEAIITDLGGMEAYANTVVKADQLGMSMLLRICYKGNCQIQNGSEYGNRIVEAYEALKSSGRLPQNGIFVHVGHNEPNNAEYIDPNQEAAFVHDTIRVLENSGYLSKNPDDAGIKAISPNLDLYISGDGQWPGCSDCDDPNPHPNYTATSYVRLMMNHSGFADVVDSLYAWAVNDYIHERGADNVPQDVRNFIASLPGGSTKQVMVTELGRINTSHGLDTLATAIAELEAMEEVEAVLLFNSLGANSDGAFSYHSELHNNPDLIKQMIANCTIGSFRVPQEGSVGARVELSGYSGSSSGSRPYSGSVGVSGYTATTGASGSYGSSMNGQDPCLGKACTSSMHDSKAVAEAGMMNGTFEEGFTQQGRSELETPNYWHPWYEHQCHGTCGIFECRSGPEFCRAPEFKPTEGQGGTVSKHFATYSTQHAGIYQRIHLGQGGTNIVEFRAKGGAFTELTPDERESGMLMIHNTKGRIGIDPTGGIDPFSSNIIWSEWKDFPNGGASGEFVALTVETSTRSEFITVFTAGNNQYPYRTVDVYWDNAELYLKNEGVTLPAIGQGEYTGSDIPSDTGGAVATPADFECDGSESTGPNGDAACWSGSNANCPDGICGNARYYSDLTVQDSSGGNVLGAKVATEEVLGVSDNVMTVDIPAESEYELKSDNFEFSNGMIANYEKGAKSIPLFQDLNGNGKHDDDEPYVPKGLSNVEITKVGGVTQMELVPGINIVSMPLYTEDFDTAAKIVDQIAAAGGYATSVGTYRNFGAAPGWNVYNQRGDQAYSDDFAFVPNDAVYIVVQQEATLQFRGSTYVDPVDTYLKPGWNLIALKGSNSQYSIQTLLATINEQTGVNARVGAIWSQGKGKYDTFVLEVDGDIYGANFIVPDDVGVFIFVDSGSGYWTPE
ncbi:MAG: hypothetical protein QY318_02645 [Candidatus Dojkabacteria bacterium]|nr:MAG: hypothetical protein QY318_02645 [Candidatus Dojkabacteria bacterium]